MYAAPYWFQAFSRLMDSALPILQVVLQIVIAVGVVVGAITAWRTKAAVEKGTGEAAVAATNAATEVRGVKAAVKETAAEVKQALEDTTVRHEAKLDSIAEVGIATHMLANSAMGEQKRLLAVKARALADETGKASDIAEAEAAEKVWADHQDKQGRLDAKEAKEAKEAKDHPASRTRN